MTEKEEDVKRSSFVTTFFFKKNKSFHLSKRKQKCDKFSKTFMRAKKQKFSTKVNKKELARKTKK